jgi:hypothetical protein
MTSGRRLEPAVKDDEDYPATYLAYVLIVLVLIIVVMIGGAALSNSFVF